MNNQIKSIKSLKNYFNESEINQSNINNLDNLFKIKKVLIRLFIKTNINNNLKKEIKELNKIIDNSVLNILINTINTLLKEYLNSLPNDLTNAQNENSIEITKKMIDKIRDKLSKYYNDLQYCYILNLNNPGLKDKMDNYLKINNLGVLNEKDKLGGLKKEDKIIYFSEYDKCRTRILQNIRCCMRVIIFLSVRFNYDADIGLLSKKYIKIVIQKATYFSSEKSKSIERNILKNEFIRELSKIYPGINGSEYIITNFETLRKIIGCEYYWSNNETKEILIKDECKKLSNLSS